ncbi:hypothetical protein HMSSN036_43120 [Paenibacillus macerans]|nr:hypothetical protein HMSSN036_43120 [Paenibacillus macerans]
MQHRDRRAAPAERGAGTASGELIRRDLPGYSNSRRICLVYREEKSLSPSVRKFNEYLLEQLPKH